MGVQSPPVAALRQCMCIPHLISDALTRRHLARLRPKATTETSKSKRVRSRDDRRAAQTAARPTIPRMGFQWPAGIPKPSRRRHGPALDYPSRAPCPNEPSASTSYLKTREVRLADADTQPRRPRPGPLRRAVSCGSLPLFAPGKSDVQVPKDTFLPLPGILMTTPSTNRTAGSQSREKHNVDKSSLLSLAALTMILLAFP